jgi:hypothetical protein
LLLISARVPPGAARRRRPVVNEFLETRDPLPGAAAAAHLRERTTHLCARKLNDRLINDCDTFLA